MVGIGLTELPNSGWAKALPAHPLKASLQQPFGQIQNGLVSGRLTCTSCKIINNIGICIVILNFKFILKCIFTQKSWKMKGIIHDLNHDLIFYCSHNSLWLPEDKVSVWITWNIYLCCYLAKTRFLQGWRRHFVESFALT